MHWDMEAERELWADVCLKSFWWFLNEAIGLPRLPDAHRWFQPYIHKPIADWFQEHVDEWLARRELLGEPTQTCLAVLLPREFAKSTLITKAGQLWLHLRNSELSTYTGSESLKLACGLLDSMKQYLSGVEPTSYFTWLYGNWYDKTRTWRAEDVVHAARRGLSRTEPSFGTWGVETGLTGRHPDALFFDDPISYDRLATDSQWFEKVREHIASLSPVLKANGLMILVGTRYGEGDHFGFAFNYEGVATVSGMELPHRVVGKLQRWHVFFMAARNADGDPTFPEQWPEWRLKQDKAQSSLKHASQLMNNPTSSEFNPLTLAQIERECLINKQDVPWNMLRYSFHCDTAFKYMKRQARGDESVIQIWGHHFGTGNVFFIEGYSSHTWRSEDFEHKLILLLQRYASAKRRIFAITDELEPGGKAGTWEQLIRKACNEANLTCPPFFLLPRTKQSKEARAKEAANYWANGFAKIIRDAPGVEKLTTQMSQIGTSAHDDWSDAASDVFNPKVYVPLRRRGLRDEQPDTSQPFDDVLLGRPRTAAQVVAIYDAYHGAPSQRTRQDEEYDFSFDY